MNIKQARLRLEHTVGRANFQAVALECVADVVGAERAVWMRHASSTGATTHLAPYLPARDLEVYERDFARLNPFVPYTTRMTAGTTGRSAALIPLREYRRTEYFGWANRTIGAFELAHIVTRIDDCPVMVSFGRNLRQSDFTQAQEQRLRTIAPFLRRACFLHSRVHAAATGPFMHLLDLAASRSACVALARDGILVEANDLADSELADGTAISQVGAYVRFRHPAAQRWFARALARGEASAAFRLPGRSVANGDDSLLLVDVSGLALPVAGRPAHWLLFVPPGRATRLQQRIATFSAEYQLTAAEGAVLARLAEGDEVPSIGEHLGHALETTRSVLKSLYRKTGTHRQAELLARLLG